MASHSTDNFLCDRRKKTYIGWLKSETHLYGENVTRVTEGIAGNLLQSFSTATMKARSRSVFFDDVKRVGVGG